jgi:hypothetical protein
VYDHRSTRRRDAPHGDANGRSCFDKFFTPTSEVTVNWLRVGYVLSSVLVLAYGCSSSEEDDATGSSGFTTTGAGAAGATGSGGSIGIGGGMDVGGASVGGGASMSGPSSGSGNAGPCTPGGTQCTDCVDNDNDGSMDAWDVECVGPLDNDEGSFATGIPGDNSDACKQDCFFDGDSGSGNDGCLWELKCDPLSPGAPDCPYDPNYNNCPDMQPQKCIDNCAEFTPNGCDCFGCCAVTLPDATVVTIKLAPGCDVEHANDPTVCKPCTQTTTCNNPCETCEYCLGKTELPPECTPAGSGGASGTGGSGSGNCDTGEVSCSPEVPCPGGLYCLTGCCIEIPS